MSAVPKGRKKEVEVGAPLWADEQRSWTSLLLLLHVVSTIKPLSLPPSFHSSLPLVQCALGVLCYICVCVCVQRRMAAVAAAAGGGGRA